MQTFRRLDNLQGAEDKLDSFIGGKHLEEPVTGQDDEPADSRRPSAGQQDTGTGGQLASRPTAAAWAHLSLVVSWHLLSSGVEMTPQRLYWPSPMERDTSSTPSTLPSLQRHRCQDSGDAAGHLDRGLPDSSSCPLDPHPLLVDGRVVLFAERQRRPLFLTACFTRLLHPAQDSLQEDRCTVRTAHPSSRRG